MSAIIASLVSLSNALAIEITGPTDVVDGDTLKIGQTRIRLDGVDAPELGQTCDNVDEGSWPCGEVARNRLEALISDDVRCRGGEHDKYGRLIAVCWTGEIEINETLVEEGLAWAFVEYSNRYTLTEERAQVMGLGIWQAKTQTAWEFRKERWQTAEQVAPDGCPIKGNISKNGRIYHVPWSPWYKRTKIDLTKGERWFCNEAEALKAGWRAPQ